MNFGDKPFKFPVPKEYVQLCQARADCTVINRNSGVTAPAIVQLKSNAPQAIIIEVRIVKYTIVYHTVQDYAA